MRVVVLSDTHLRDERARRLPPSAYEALTDADVILHCGDVVERGVLDELATYAPVHAVLGNNDVGLRGALPEQLIVDLDGLLVGMIHDSGPTKGRPARMRRRFPMCGLVVFGHSHAPVDEMGLDGQWLLNPGSPTQRRRQPTPSFARFTVDAGVLTHHEIVVVGD
jgi:putative phosphoesterase